MTPPPTRSPIARRPQSEVTSLEEARVRRAADALVVGTIGGGVARPVALGVVAQTPLPAARRRAGDDHRGSRGACSRWASRGAGAGSLECIRRAAPRARRRLAGRRRRHRRDDLRGCLLVGGPGACRRRRRRWSRRGGRWYATGSVGTGDDPTPSYVAATSSQIALATSATSFDAGTFSPPPPPPPPPSSGPSFWDACSASSDSCDTTGTEDSSCSSTDDGSDSSCSGTDDGSADACTAPPDDGGSCRVSPGRERPRDATIVWVLAPLGFLLGRRR